MSLQVEKEAIEGSLLAIRHGRAETIEECAKVADAEERRYLNQGPTAVSRCYAEAARYIAASIRALSGES